MLLSQVMQEFWGQFLGQYPAKLAAAGSATEASRGSCGIWAAVLQQSSCYESNSSSSSSSGSSSGTDTDMRSHTCSSSSSSNSSSRGSSHTSKDRAGGYEWFGMGGRSEEQLLIDR
jgi:hypothetical protein